MAKNTPPHTHTHTHRELVFASPPPFPTLYIHICTQDTHVLRETLRVCEGGGAQFLGIIQIIIIIIIELQSNEQKI